MIGSRLGVAAEVGARIAAGRPVVALESTLISHGLPYPRTSRSPAPRRPRSGRPGRSRPRWRSATAGSSSGLDDVALRALARRLRARCLKGRAAESRRGPRPIWMAATTVSATMIAPRRWDRRVSRRAESAASPRTGRLRVAGHLVRSRGAGRTPNGPSSAPAEGDLDIPATLEYLETRGVRSCDRPVGAAGFFARSAGVAAPTRSRTKRPRPPRRDASGPRSPSAILLCVPPPRTVALSP